MQQPDNTGLSTKGTGQVPLSTALSRKAQTALILSNLKSSSLISMGQLCDDGCAVVLLKDKLVVIKEKKIILQGTRNHTDDLWDIPIHKNNISPQNYKTPPIHAGLYQTNSLVPKTGKIDNPTRKIRPPKPRS